MYNHKEPWKQILFQCPITLQNQTKRMISHHLLKPFKSKEISYFYQMDQSIFVFRVVGCFFYSYSNLNRTSCKQTVENLIRHYSLWHMILACTICLCPTKITLVSNGLNTFVVYVAHISCIVSSSNWKIIEYRAVLTI